MNKIMTHLVLYKNKNLKYLFDTTDEIFDSFIFYDIEQVIQFYHQPNSYKKSSETDFQQDKIDKNKLVIICPFYNFIVLVKDSSNKWFIFNEKGDKIEIDINLIIFNDKFKFIFLDSSNYDDKKNIQDFQETESHVSPSDVITYFRNIIEYYEKIMKFQSDTKLILEYLDLFSFSFKEVYSERKYTDIKNDVKFRTYYRFCSYINDVFFFCSIYKDLDKKFYVFRALDLFYIENVLLSYFIRNSKIKDEKYGNKNTIIKFYNFILYDLYQDLTLKQIIVFFLHQNKKYNSTSPFNLTKVPVSVNRILHDKKKLKYPRDVIFYTSIKPESITIFKQKKIENEDNFQAVYYLRSFEVKNKNIVNLYNCTIGQDSFFSNFDNYNYFLYNYPLPESLDFSIKNVYNFVFSLSKNTCTEIIKKIIRDGTLRSVQYSLMTFVSTQTNSQINNDDFETFNVMTFNILNGSITGEFSKKEKDKIYNTCGEKDEHNHIQYDTSICRIKHAQNLYNMILMNYSFLAFQEDFLDSKKNYNYFLSFNDPAADAVEIFNNEIKDEDNPNYLKLKDKLISVFDMALLSIDSKEIKNAYNVKEELKSIEVIDFKNKSDKKGKITDMFVLYNKSKYQLEKVFIYNFTDFIENSYPTSDTDIEQKLISELVHKKHKFNLKIYVYMNLPTKNKHSLINMNDEFNNYKSKIYQDISLSDEFYVNCWIEKFTPTIKQDDVIDYFIELFLEASKPFKTVVVNIRFPVLNLDKFFKEEDKYNYYKKFTELLEKIKNDPEFKESDFIFLGDFNVYKKDIENKLNDFKFVVKDGKPDYIVTDKTNKIEQTVFTDFDTLNSEPSISDHSPLCAKITRNIPSKFKIQFTANENENEYSFSELKIKLPSLKMYDDMKTIIDYYSIFFDELDKYKSIKMNILEFNNGENDFVNIQGRFMVKYAILPENDTISAKLFSKEFCDFVNKKTKKDDTKNTWFLKADKIWNLIYFMEKFIKHLNIEDSIYLNFLLVKTDMETFYNKKKAENDKEILDATTKKLTPPDEIKTIDDYDFTEFFSSQDFKTKIDTYYKTNVTNTVVTIGKKQKSKHNTKQPQTHPQKSKPKHNQPKPKHKKP